MVLPTLITKRLILRPPVPQDADAIVGPLNDPSVHQWLSETPVPYTRDDGLWFINEVQEGRIMAWMIEADGTLQGVVGGPKLGYWLAPDAWGKGYATEMGHAVLDHLFQSDPARTEIKAGYFEGNDPSRKVLEKLGLEDTGPESFTRKSEPHKVQGRAMVLKRSTWAVRRAFTIHTDRLTLRPLEFSDAPAFAELGRHPLVAPMMLSMTLDWTEEDAAKMIAESRFDGQPGFRVAICKGDQLIGVAGMMTKRIMYAIHPDHWGNGYVTEAVTAFLDEVDARLALPQLEADHFTNNPASGKVLRKLGFVETGTEMATSRARAASEEVTVYARNRWASHRPLQTGDVTLRPRAQSDVEPVHNMMLSDWEVTRQLGSWPWPPDINVTRDRLNRPVEGEGMVWTIDYAGEVAGTIGLVNGMIGYSLMPRFHRKGIMSRAVQLSIDWGFARYDWPAIEAGCWEDNAASAGLLLKHGFIETGQRVQRSLARGQNVGLREFRLDRPVV